MSCIIISCWCALEQTTDSDTASWGIILMIKIITHVEKESNILFLGLLNIIILVQEYK